MLAKRAAFARKYGIVGIRQKFPIIQQPLENELDCGGLSHGNLPEQMLEPLLNGNEIMSVTNLAPGPQVGLIRDALLKAQISGDVTDAESARAFVKEYARKSVG